MKHLAMIFSFMLFFAASPIKASSVNEIYSSVLEQVEFYYQATGEWTVVKVSPMSVITTDSKEFMLVSVKALIRNINTGKSANEICLISYIKENQEFHSINCFSN